MSVLLFKTWQTTRERITSWRIWRSYLFGPRINKQLETKPLDFWLSWMERHHIWQHIYVRVSLHQKSFPNFTIGWTRSRWIRRRFVQIWLSIILMTCRHSIECIMWRDSQLDRTQRGQIELRWVYDCPRSFSLRLWIQPLSVVTKKGFRWDYPCCHLSCWLVVCIDSEEKESLQFRGFLSSVYCILVTYGLHGKNRFNNHKVVAELFGVNLVGDQVPMNWYCSRFNNADE